MADDKNIKFRAYVDAADFDRGITDIQRKMKQLQSEMQRAQNTQRMVSTDPVVGKFAKEFFQSSQGQSGKQLQEDISKQRSEIQNTRARVQEKQKELDKYREQLQIQKDAEKLDKVAIKDLERKVDLSNRLVLNLNKVGSSQSNDLGAMLSTAGSAGIDVGMGQNMGPLSANRIGQLRGRAGDSRAFRKMGFGRGMARGMSLFGGPAAVAGGLVTAVGGAAVRGITGIPGVFDEMAEKERRISMARGSAADSGSLELQRIMGGKGMENVYFSEERKRAAGVVGEEFKNRRGRDILRNTVSGATPGMWGMVGGGAMMAAGAAMSATGIGAAAGIPLMAAGAGVAGLGAVGAVGGGIGNNLTRENRQALFGTDEYYSNLTSEQLQKTRSVEQAERKRNIRKYSGYQFLTQNEGMFNQYQQAFGESDSMKAGGLLDTFTGMGMTGQTALGIGQSMGSAAGMTVGQGQAGDVRSAYRMKQAGLTNMDKAMGVMRGVGATMGDKTSTDESLKKFFSEAFSTGITDSGMVEEIRTFTNASMQLSMQTGMGLSEAAGQVSKGMVGEFSAFGLQSQKGARDIQRGLSTAGGASLDYKLAFAGSKQGKEMLGENMDTADVLQFTNMDIDNISEDNPNVKALMKKMGVTDVDEFRRRKSQFDIAGGVRRGDTRKSFLDFTKKMSGMSGKERASYLQSEEGSGEYQNISKMLEAENPAFKTGFAKQMQLFGRYGDELNPQSKDGKNTVLRDVGGDMYADALGRGAGQTTTGMEGQRAADQNLMLDWSNSGIDGGESPLEMLGRSAKDYDAATQAFANAVKDLETILAKGNLEGKDREQVINIMRDMETQATSPDQPSTTATTGRNTVLKQ